MKVAVQPKNRECRGKLPQPIQHACVSPSKQCNHRREIGDPALTVDYYTKILDRSRKSLDDLQNDDEKIAAFTSAHNAIKDLECLEIFLQGRAEAEMFRLAKIEYHHALYSASVAQYRQAHVSLRLFFELSLCCVLFSAHEINMHLWMKDQKDSNWSSIISNENGVLSKMFSGAFFPEMKEHCEQYRAMAEALYRECSQFVHENRNSFDGIDGEMAYNPEILDAWVDRADTALRVVKFAFACRYLKVSERSQRDVVEDMMLGDFGDLPPVQAQFERKEQ